MRSVYIPGCVYLLHRDGHLVISHAGRMSSICAVPKDGMCGSCGICAHVGPVIDARAYEWAELRGQDAIIAAYCPLRSYLYSLSFSGWQHATVSVTNSAKQLHRVVATTSGGDKITCAGLMGCGSCTDCGRTYILSLVRCPMNVILTGVRPGTARDFTIFVQDSCTRARVLVFSYLSNAMVTLEGIVCRDALCSLCSRLDLASEGAQRIQLTEGSPLASKALSAYPFEKKRQKVMAAWTDKNTKREVSVPVTKPNLANLDTLVSAAAAAAAR